jgi:cytoskeletal protein RodZ
VNARASELKPLEVPSGEKGKGSVLLRLVIGLLVVGGIFALSWPALQGWWSSGARRPVSLPASTTAPVLEITQSPSPDPVVVLPPTSITTSIPSETVEPAPTSTPERVFALELPRATTPQLLIHQVVAGENYTLLEKRYGTSAAAIQSINPSQPVGLWAGFMVVIPLNTLDVSDLPGFETYQVKNVSLTLAALAEKLGADVGLMERYNLLQAQDVLPVDAWLLVPRPRATQVP